MRLFTRIKASVANFMTFCSMVLGIMAIVITARAVSTSTLTLSIMGTACWMIMIAFQLDGMDGFVARRLGSASVFGIWFDSVADFVAFGTAPAVLMCHLIITTLSPWFLIIPLLYILAGGFRLARFNCTATTGKKGHFSGLPITMSGGIMASLTLVMGYVQNRELLSPTTATIIIICTALCISVLMVSTIKFDTMGRFVHHMGMFRFYCALTVALMVAVMVAIEWSLLYVGSLYVIVSLIRWVVKDIPEKRRSVV